MDYYFSVSLGKLTLTTIEERSSKVEFFSDRQKKNREKKKKKKKDVGRRENKKERRKYLVEGACVEVRDAIRGVAGDDCEELVDYVEQQRGSVLRRQSD